VTKSVAYYWKVDRERTCVWGGIQVVRLRQSSDPGPKLEATQLSLHAYGPAEARDMALRQNNNLSGFQKRLGFATTP
jgi:hypothetical protein